MGDDDRDRDKDKDQDKDRDDGRHRDKAAEEISRNGQQKGRSLPPIEDGREKH